MLCIKSSTYIPVTSALKRRIVQSKSKSQEYIYIQKTKKIHTEIFQTAAPSAKCQWRFKACSMDSDDNNNNDNEEKKKKKNTLYILCTMYMSQ